MRSALLALPLATLALSGCGSADAGAATTVTVRATDEACELDRTSLPAGRTSFAVTNHGGKATEVYVYAGSKIVAEKEDIGPGTSVDLAVDLAAGGYEVACKPGQTGNGIRTPITVG